MSDRRPWDFGDLDGYLREEEPEQAERAANWQIAIGLQAVDGLSVSPYLLETAKEHIEGRIDLEDAERRVRSYYRERASRAEKEAAEEADTVSTRISRLLETRSFTFSPVQLRAIQGALFDELLPEAGKYRPYNMSKAEWALKGDTVTYASYETIPETLRYDFDQERSFSYAGLPTREAVAHLARFFSGIWQIHPFCEGNTRTTAVFAIKYLRSMGYSIDNEPFRRHSWYFRNALVRANYEDVTRGIRPTTTYLERFFENLLYGAHHELRNRYLHLDWPKGQAAAQEAGEITQQVTQQVAQLVNALGDDELTLKELMGRLSLSDRNNFTKNYLNPALEAGLIERTVPDKPTSRFQRYRRV